MRSPLDIERRIFVCWFGSASLPAPRLHGLETLEREAGVPVILITEQNIGDWVIEGHPLHPAFPLLTPVHRADHLRTYLMHHHGGGYSDIKPTTSSWVDAFDEVDARGALGAGYPEIGRHGVASMGVSLTLGRRYELRPFDRRWWEYRWLQANHRRLVGNGAYIFRPRTPFTAAWLMEQERRLDRLLPALRANPGKHPKERGGHMYHGVVSQYPVGWSEILGDIFHPLVLRHHRRIARSVPPPDWGLPYQ